MCLDTPCTAAEAKGVCYENEHDFLVVKFTNKKEKSANVQGVERNCDDLFKPVITDDGQCCAFNIMPESIMYKWVIQRLFIKINNR